MDDLTGQTAIDHHPLRAMNASPEYRSVTYPLHRAPFSPDTVALIHEINRQCLDLLIETAHHMRTPTNLLGQLHADLCRADAQTLRRAAEQPFLLVDVRFADESWWRSLAAHPDQAWSTRKWLVTFPRTATIRLMRAALTLAWQSSRADRDAARLLVGLAPAVADTLTSLPWSTVDRIAERHFRHLRPRWEECPTVWRLLLQAPRTDGQYVGRFGSYALQLAAGSQLRMR